LDELTKTLSEIHKNFISPDAPKQLNLSHGMMKQMNADIKMTTTTTLPAMELIFTDAQEYIENILASDIYPRFVKHQMTTSAVKALSGGGRQKYAGLGDCFCLTNPA
jgi:phototropin